MFRSATFETIAGLSTKKVWWQNKASDGQCQPHQNVKLKLLDKLRFMKTIFTLLIALLLVGQADAQMKETRKLPPFRSLSVTQSIEVELVKGNEEKAEISSDEIDLDDILTDVSGGRLKIHLDGWNRNWRGKVRVVLTYRELEGVSVGASASVAGNDVIVADSFAAEASSSGRLSLAVNCKELEVEVSSSGRVSLRGNAFKQRIEGSSSGQYDGFDLDSETVKADVSSSGRVNVSVSKELIADVSSSGRVTYKGKPDKLIADQNSSGKVVRY